MFVAMPSSALRKSVYVLRSVNMRSRMIRRLQASPNVCRAKLIGQSERRSVRFIGAPLHDASCDRSLLALYKGAHRGCAMPCGGGIMPQKVARVALTVVSYMAATFGVQGASHFAVNADYY